MEVLDQYIDHLTERSAIKVEEQKANEDWDAYREIVYEAWLKRQKEIKKD